MEALDKQPGRVGRIWYDFPVAPIIVRGSLPHLNQYIQAERGNRFNAARLKKEATELVAWSARNAVPVTHYPVDVTLTWYVKSNRGKYPDPDNIAFATKFVLDGLVEAGVIVDDTFQQIGEIRHRYKWNVPRPGVAIQLCPKDSKVLT